MGREPNSALREAIAQTGWTYDSVARAVRRVAAEAGDTLHTNRASVAHWIAGRPPTPKTVRYLTEALSRRLRRPLLPNDLGLPSTSEPEGSDLGLEIGPDPLEQLGRIGRYDIERRTFLTRAAYSVAALLPLTHAHDYTARLTSVRRGGAAGDAEIAAVRDMTRLLTAVDERHGGQHGRSAVVQYLTTDVDQLCRASWRTTDQHKEMLSAAADVAYLAGWKAYDAGEHGLAQRYYLQAYALTREAGNDAHSAWVLRILAHHGMDIERPEYVLDLADAAVSVAGGHVDAASAALHVGTRGRALAAANQPVEALAEMERAAALAAEADETEMPPWAALWGPARATIANHTAKVFARIGDYAAAEHRYKQAVAGRPEAQYQRVNALSTASAASMQCAQGALEQACATWSHALDTMTGIRSARTRTAVTDMRTDLRSLRRRGVKAAADLDERAAAWLTTA